MSETLSSKLAPMIQNGLKNPSNMARCPRRDDVATFARRKISDQIHKKAYLFGKKSENQKVTKPAKFTKTFSQELVIG